MLAFFLVIIGKIVIFRAIFYLFVILLFLGDMFIILLFIIDWIIFFGFLIHHFILNLLKIVNIFFTHLLNFYSIFCLIFIFNYQNFLLTISYLQLFILIF